MRRSSPYLLAGVLAGAAVTHFTHPRFYDRMVPRPLPGPPRAYTWGSGVAELAVAGTLLRPRTRRRGALAAATLLVAVFPANVQMALDAKRPRERLLTYARLPLQLPLVAWAWRISRTTGR